MRSLALFCVVFSIMACLPERAFGQNTQTSECSSGFIKSEPSIGKKFQSLQDWVSFAKALDVNKSYSENLSDPAHYKAINAFIESNANLPLFQSINGLAYYYQCFGNDKNRTKALELFELAENSGDPIAIQVLSVQPEYQNDKNWKKSKIAQLKKNKSQDISQSLRLSFEADKNFEKIQELTKTGFIPFWEIEKRDKKLKRWLEPYCNLHSKAYGLWKQNFHALSGLSVCNHLRQGYNNVHLAYSLVVGMGHIGHPKPQNVVDQMAIKLGNTDAIEEAYRNSYEFVGLRTPITLDENYQRHIQRILEISQLNRQRNTQKANTYKQPPTTHINSKGILGHLSHEQENDFSKICYYEFLEELKALNVKSVEICPLTHKFDH